MSLRSTGTPPSDSLGSMLHSFRVGGLGQASRSVASYAVTSRFARDGGRTFRSLSAVRALGFLPGLWVSSYIIQTPPSF